MILYIFQAFYEVWRRAREHRKLRTLSPQRKHEKTLDFYTDYPLFCILDVFLICFFTYFLTVKRVIFNHTKKQVNYHTKVIVCNITSQRLCNRIAFCMPILHFSSRFTVADWRKNTTVKLDSFEAERSCVTNPPL